MSMTTRRLFVLTSAAAAGTSLLGTPINALAAESQIRIAIGEEPSTVDHSASWTGVDYQIAENYGEFLIQRATNGDLKPGLATSWKISADGKTVDFSLRRNVKFHSGDAFTAKDVLFSMERGRTKSATVKSRLSSVERIEVIDDFTVRMHFKAPDVTFIPNRAAAMMVSKAYFDKVGEDMFSRQPVGTGPYKFSRFVSGEYMDIERFSGYWGDKAKLTAARFFFIAEDTTRVAKLKAGEVDLINACPYSAVKDLQSRSDFKLVKLSLDHPTMSVVFATQNPKVPWYDKRVRQAMAHAVDTDAIIKNVLSGIPTHWPFLAPHELGYDASVKNIAYDPAKARALLAQAGISGGFDLKLYYAVTGRVQMNTQVAEAIASYFEAVGIRTRLIGEEWLAYRARYNAAKKPDADYVALFTHGRAGSPDPTYNMALFFSKDGPISVYSNPDLDKLNAQAKATVDPVKRADLIREEVRLIQADVPSFPIYNNVTIYAMRKNITFTPTQKYNFDLTLVKDMAFQ
jgi:peptide/nickel transport system substrate-binding protein